MPIKQSAVQKFTRYAMSAPFDELSSALDAMTAVWKARREGTRLLGQPESTETTSRAGAKLRSAIRKVRAKRTAVAAAVSAEGQVALPGSDR